eukprot:scaffold108884_cov29-Phaeocystis_antarctica.AAC.1
MGTHLHGGVHGVRGVCAREARGCTRGARGWHGRVGRCEGCRELGAGRVSGAMQGDASRCGAAGAGQRARGGGQCRAAGAGRRAVLLTRGCKCCRTSGTCGRTRAASS